MTQHILISCLEKKQLKDWPVSDFGALENELRKNATFIEVARKERLDPKDVDYYVENIPFGDKYSIRLVNGPSSTCLPSDREIIDIAKRHFSPAPSIRVESTAERSSSVVSSDRLPTAFLLSRMSEQKKKNHEKKDPLSYSSGRHSLKMEKPRCHSPKQTHVRSQKERRGPGTKES